MMRPIIKLHHAGGGSMTQPEGSVATLVHEPRQPWAYDRRRLWLSEEELRYLARRANEILARLEASR